MTNIRSHSVPLSRWPTLWGIMAQNRNLQTFNKNIPYKFKSSPLIGIAADGPTGSETGGQT
jgi:hypothetical protein